MTPDQFQLIADHAAEPLLLVSPTGELRAANEAAARLLGYATTQLRSMPMARITTEPASVIASYLRGRGAGEKHVPRSCSLRAQSGKLIRCRCETTVVHDGSRESPTSFLVRLFPEKSSTGRLLPQRGEPVAGPASQTAGPASAGGNTLVQAILDTAVDAIITIDACGRIESFNRAAEHMFGYTCAELVGRDVSLLMPSPHREAHQTYVDTYLKTGQERVIGIGREVLAVRKDGTMFPADLAISESQVRGRRLFTGILRDLTERREAAEQIQLLAEAVRHLHEGVVITDGRLPWPGPRILFVNSAMTEITGYAREELIGHTPRLLQGPHANRRELNRLRQNLSAGRSFTGELVNCRKDGTLYPAGLFISPVKDAAGRITHFVAIHRDLTERKRAEDKLLQAERLAAIGQMVTGLAHESRNAFQRSQVCLEMLQLEVEDRPEAIDLIGRIQKAQDHLHHLYEEVQQYAAPVNIVIEPCNLAHVWREVWTHLGFEHGSKGLKLDEDIEDVDLTCRADAFALGQVFRNLLENAIAASPDNASINMRGRQATLDGKWSIELVVCDRGPGFPPGVQERIFEPFFTTKTKGTGLGMPIAQRIVQAHGGTLTARHREGGGAAFVLTLPR